MIVHIYLLCSISIVKIALSTCTFLSEKGNAQKILPLCKEIPPLNLVAAFVRSTEERLNKDTVQSKVSRDWLEITRSDLYSEICIDKKKKDDYAKRKHCTRGIYATIQMRGIYISRKNCMSAFLYGSNTESRMKIDQTWCITNTKANFSNMLYWRTIDT